MSFRRGRFRRGPAVLVSGEGLGRGGGGCEGVSRMLLSFGRFLKVSQDSFGVPDTAGTRRRLLRQLPYLREKAFLGYFKKLLQNFISIRDTPSQPPPALQSPSPDTRTAGPLRNRPRRKDTNLGVKGNEGVE